MTTPTMYYFVLILDSISFLMLFSICLVYLLLRKFSERMRTSACLHLFVTVLGHVLILNQLIIINPFLQVLVEVFVRETQEQTLYYIVLVTTVVSLTSNFLVVIYTDLFVSFLFPSENIPWAAWNNRSQLFKNLWKMMLIYSDIIFTGSYVTLSHIGSLFLLLACIYERVIRAPYYNFPVHFTALLTDSY